jgi:hypothetical protein
MTVGRIGGGRSGIAEREAILMASKDGHLTMRACIVDARHPHCRRLHVLLLFTISKRRISVFKALCNGASDDAHISQYWVAPMVGVQDASNFKTLAKVS